MQAQGDVLGNLVGLVPGDRARVVSVDAAAPFAVRLKEMGLVAGTEFEVLKLAPLGDPVQIQVRGYHLCLRKRETEGFVFERLGSAEGRGRAR